MLHIQDSDAKKFSFHEKFYCDQLRKDLLINIYKNGTFGSYRHLLLEPLSNEATLSVEHAYINTLTRGDLSSLRWIESHPSHFKYVLYFCLWKADFIHLFHLFNF